MIKLRLQRLTAIDAGLWSVSLLLAATLVVLSMLPHDQAATTAVRMFAGLLALMIVYDVTTLRVPNLLVYSAVLFALAATAIVDSGLLVDALEGGFVLLIVMYAVAMIGKGAMGMGDVKVGVFIGCVLGLNGGFLALLFGFALGGLFAAVVLVLHLRERKDVTALTPFLAGSALVYMAVFGSLLSS